MTDEPRSEPGHATPEGYTAEEPAVGELGEPGTPGAGMTPDAPHAADAEAVELGEPPADSDAEAVEHGEAPADSLAETGGVAPASASAASVAHHDANTHMDAHTSISDDDHGHAEQRLGPIDWGAWAYALVGAAAGLVVVALFWVAVSR